jgi:hypothetical protein
MNSLSRRKRAKSIAPGVFCYCSANKKFYSGSPSVGVLPVILASAHLLGDSAAPVGWNGEHLKNLDIVALGLLPAESAHLWD